jgi:hypothetical protein
MSDSARGCVSPLIQGDAEVVKTRAVGIKTFVVYPKNSYELRSEV